jgi:hypothetical protein
MKIREIIMQVSQWKMKLKRNREKNRIRVPKVDQLQTMILQGLRPQNSHRSQMPPLILLRKL